ncbi:hypothetical protein R80B4_00972 [Fibrobacteres bacterium R8-0-B4]
MVALIGCTILIGIVGFFAFLLLAPVVAVVGGITDGLICLFTGKGNTLGAAPEADEGAKAKITVEIFAEKPFTIEEMELINEHREEQENKARRRRQRLITSVLG